MGPFARRTGKDQWACEKNTYIHVYMYTYLYVFCLYSYH